MQMRSWKKRYSEDLEMGKMLFTTAILTLKEGFEGQMDG